MLFEPVLGEIVAKSIDNSPERSLHRDMYVD